MKSHLMRVEDPLTHVKLTRAEHKTIIGCLGILGCVLHGLRKRCQPRRRRSTPKRRAPKWHFGTCRCRLEG